MATHSSILAWRIPWTEEPGELQFMGSQRVGRDSGANFHFSLSLSSYFELSNYSFSRNWFTLAKKKANQQINHFRGSQAFLAASAAALGYP